IFAGGPGACFGRATSPRSRAWRESCRGLAAPVSITTRRRRPGPPAPPRGLIGLFGRSAIAPLSVEPREARFDLHRLAKRPRERPPRDRALEARQPPVRVDAPTGVGGPRPRQPSLPSDEAQELRLGRLAAAAGARPDRAVW